MLVGVPGERKGETGSIFLAGCLIDFFFVVVVIVIVVVGNAMCAFSMMVSWRMSMACGSPYSGARPWDMIAGCRGGKR